MSGRSLIPVERITSAIVLLRGHKVLLDSDLAALYGVPVKVLNQAVRRNRQRFPGDFMFQLSRGEMAALRSQSVTLDVGRGVHRKYRPYARKLDALEQRYDARFKIVFQAIRELMAPRAETPKRIGFRTASARPPSTAGRA